LSLRLPPIPMSLYSYDSLSPLSLCPSTSLSLYLSAPLSLYPSIPLSLYPSTPLPRYYPSIPLPRYYPSIPRMCHSLYPAPSPAHESSRHV
jgi:hypothetical protein